MNTCNRYFEVIELFNEKYSELSDRKASVAISKDLSLPSETVRKYIKKFNKGAHVENGRSNLIIIFFYIFDNENRSI